MGCNIGKLIRAVGLLLTSAGDFQLFHGKEWIEHEGQIVYELRYHGGLVKS